VSPELDNSWCTSDCPVVGVRAIALSQSVPTPNTHEPFRVVTSDALGAPVDPLVFAIAPTAPEPPVPDTSTPVNDMTVIDDTTDLESVAVTVTFDSVDVANARQTSAVPAWVLLRTTSVQVSEAPVTPVTVMAVPDGPSEETKASSNSFGAAVENDGDATVVAAVARSVDFVTSVASAANDRDAASRTKRRLSVTVLERMRASFIAKWDPN
jgi:hypothetical protein